MQDFFTISEDTTGTINRRDDLNQKFQKKFALHGVKNWLWFLDCGASLNGIFGPVLGIDLMHAANEGTMSYVASQVSGSAGEEHPGGSGALTGRLRGKTFAQGAKADSQEAISENQLHERDNVPFFSGSP